ncbi:MAG: nuclear transport factor 2 family protein [Acidobacteriota bacterium]|nr:MAG: nuclear transport factor 2 family protein [Acidobacteriota bacterium]
MKIIISIALVLAFAGAACAQASVLDRFYGTWQGAGKVNGRESAVVMTWEPVHGGKNYRLDFRNEMEGGFLFEGTALYSLKKEGGFTGLWVDSAGSVHPLEASFANDTLTTNWGTPETEEGRTEYRLTGGGEMLVIDSVKTKEGWREFGRVEYRLEADLTSKVYRFTNAYNQGDLKEMLDLVHDEVSWHRIDGGTIRTETKGKAALKESLDSYFAGERRTVSKIEKIMTSGNFVTVTERATWNDKDGVQKSQAAVIVYEFKDGLILNVWDFPAYR